MTLKRAKLSRDELKGLSAQCRAALTGRTDKLHARAYRWSHGNEIIFYAAVSDRSEAILGTFRASSDPRRWHPVDGLPDDVLTHINRTVMPPVYEDDTIKEIARRHSAALKRMAKR